jgi:hypothetical protein
VDSDDDYNNVKIITVTRAHTWQTPTDERQVCTAAPTLEPNFPATCLHILLASGTVRNVNQGPEKG